MRAARRSVFYILSSTVIPVTRRILFTVTSFKYTGRSHATQNPYCIFAGRKNAGVQPLTYIYWPSSRYDPVGPTRNKVIRYGTKYSNPGRGIKQKTIWKRSLHFYFNSSRTTVTRIPLLYSVYGNSRARGIFRREHNDASIVGSHPRRLTTSSITRFIRSWATITLTS